MPQRGHAGLILPVATSGATLGLALFQYPLFNAFTQPHKGYQTSLAGRPLAQYWRASLLSVPGLVLGMTLATAATGLVSSRWLHTHSTLETTNISRWYLYGSVLALGHGLFYPLLAGEVKRQIDADESGKTDAEVEEINRESMKAWMMWHTIRTFTVDLGAVICFAEGVAQSLWIV